MDIIPSIDHSLLSPGGRMSKAARERAIAREAERLFPPGFWTPPELSPDKAVQAKITGLQRHAQELRELAARGMGVRKHVREAERLEEEARALGGHPGCGS